MLSAQVSDLGPRFWIAFVGTLLLAVGATAVAVAKWRTVSPDTVRSPYLLRDDHDALVGMVRAMVPDLVAIWSLVLGLLGLVLAAYVNPAFIVLLLLVFLFPVCMIPVATTFLIARPRFLIPPRLRNTPGYLEVRLRRRRSRAHSPATTARR